jgi:crotonobetaine/carnitine-CoA ligase
MEPLSVEEEFMEEKIDTGNKELNLAQEQKKSMVFKTMEEVITYAQKQIPLDQVILKRADGGSICMGEYMINLNKICNMFLELGVNKGRNVAVFLPNCLEYSYFYLALGRIGVPVLPVNQYLKGDALRAVLNHCDIRFLVTNKELYLSAIDPIESELEAMDCVIFMDEKVSAGKLGNSILFHDFKKYSDNYKQPWPVEGKDTAVIWLTSGTTGLPKGVVCTQEYLLQRVSYSANFFNVKPSDAIYFVLPMYHIPFYCWGVPLAMAGGCKVVFVDWFSASRFWELAAKHNATIVYTTGTIIPILLKQDIGEFEKQASERVRIWSAWPVDQPDVVFKRWPKTKFVTGYGLSEYALATMSVYNSEKRSEGLPTPFTELRICDPETGEDLPTGKAGEIVLRCNLGPGFMMQGYYKSPKATDETIKNEWLYTGDCGYLDEKKELHFVDRLKDSVRVGGENVPSVQVEGIIARHPKIAEVAIVGVPGENNGLGGMEIAAHVVLRPGDELSAEDFFKYCEEKMAYFMVPRYLRISKELPKTANFKVQKYKLRKEVDTKNYVRKTGARQK